MESVTRLMSESRIREELSELKYMSERGWGRVYHTAKRLDALGYGKSDDKKSAPSLLCLTWN